MNKPLGLALLLMMAQAWGDPVAGSLDVEWYEGAADCEKAGQQPQLQVHRAPEQVQVGAQQELRLAKGVAGAVGPPGQDVLLRRRDG